MHQVRNLVLNVIWNVGIVVLLVCLNVYSFTKLPWHGIMFATLFEMCIIQWIFNRLTDEYDSRRYAYPPFGVVILAVLLFSYFYKRKLRVLKSQDYKVFAFCEDGTVNIIYFDKFMFELLGDISFNGSEDSKKQIIYQIEHEVDSRYPKSANEYDFNNWDGTLDEATKRKNTIKNILK